MNLSMDEIKELSSLDVQLQHLDSQTTDLITQRQTVEHQLSDTTDPNTFTPEEQHLRQTIRDIGDKLNTIYQTKLLLLKQHKQKMDQEEKETNESTLSSNDNSSTTQLRTSTSENDFKLLSRIENILKGSNNMISFRKIASKLETYYQQEYSIMCNEHGDLYSYLAINNTFWVVRFFF